MCSPFKDCVRFSIVEEVITYKTKCQADKTLRIKVILVFLQVSICVYFGRKCLQWAFRQSLASESRTIVYRGCKTCKCPCCHHNITHTPANVTRVKHVCLSNNCLKRTGL